MAYTVFSDLDMLYRSKQRAQKKFVEKKTRRTWIRAPTASNKHAVASQIRVLLFYFTMLVLCIIFSSRACLNCQIQCAQFTPLLFPLCQLVLNQKPISLTLHESNKPSGQRQATVKHEAHEVNFSFPSKCLRSASWVGCIWLKCNL